MRSSTRQGVLDHAKQVEDGTVSVCHRNHEDLATMALEELAEKITTEIRERSL